MARVANFVKSGRRVLVKLAADTGIGNVVAIGTGRIGITCEDGAKDDTVNAQVTGVYELPADNTAAFTQGDTLYWDATNGKLTKTAEGNTTAGWAYEDKAQAGTVAKVHLGLCE